MLSFARHNGYIETITGRRCYIHDILSKNFNLRQFSERQALNAIIQGTAADIVKIAMIQIHPLLHDLFSRMLIQIHDELVFEIKNDKLEQAVREINNIMENCISLSIPLKVNVETGTFLQ